MGIRKTIFGRQKWNFIAEPEYQAVLDKATLMGYVKPLKKEMFYQNKMVKELKAAGIWNRLDQLYNFYYTGTASFSLINWINPALLLTKTATATFINKSGMRSGVFTDTASVNLSSAYNSSISGGNYQVGDASFGYVRGENGTTGFQSSSASYVMASGASADELKFRESIDRFYFQNSGNYYTVSGLPIDKAGRFFVMNRNGTNSRLYMDSVKKSDTTLSLSANVNYTYEFLYNPSSGYLETIRLGFTGGKLTETQINDFYIIWQSYLNKVQ